MVALQCGSFATHHSRLASTLKPCAAPSLRRDPYRTPFVDRSFCGERPLRQPVLSAAEAEPAMTTTTAAAEPAAEGSVAPIWPAPSPTFIQQMINEGKLFKSRLSKLPVAALRGECQALELSTGGLKADLIDRLMGWVQANPAAIAKPVQSTPPLAKKSPKTSSSATAAAAPAASKAAAQRAMEPPEMRVTWLGTSSGAPSNRRNVSAVAYRIGTDRIFLVDCGEGSHNQLRSAGLDAALVSHIFVTHLHGDHCFGVAGMLASIARCRAGSSKINEPVHVYGPPELQKLLVATCRSAGLQLGVPVVFTAWVLDPQRAAAPAPVDPAKKLMLGAQAADQAGGMPREVLEGWQHTYDNGSDNVVHPGLTWSTKLPGGLKVTAAQLQHRIPCWGYVFQEPNRPADNNRPADPQEAAEDEDMELEGGSGSSGSCCEKEWVRPGRKIVILGDTCDSTAIAPVARGCDLLSHEATFQMGMEEKARIATHSTSEQAGRFARAVRARVLVLTHFSARYEQGDSYKKRWVSAREKGVSMKQLDHQVVGELANEARAVSGGAKVYLANDFYTFRVPPRESLPADKLAAKVAAEREREREISTAARAGNAEARQGLRQGGGEGERRMAGGGGGGNGRRTGYAGSGDMREMRPGYAAKQQQGRPGMQQRSRELQPRGLPAPRASE